MSKKTTVNNKEIAKEIKGLIGHIEGVTNELKQAVPRFRQAYKNCDFAREWQGQGLATPQYLKLVCERGTSYLQNYIVNPLMISLLNYRDLLIGEKAYTGTGKVTLMKGLISAIHRYVVISSFFGKNPSYLVPGMGTEQRKFQKEFKKVILENNRRLMGCDEGHKFPIQKIVAEMGMSGDHKKILNYMNTQCLLLRKELLK